VYKTDADPLSGALQSELKKPRELLLKYFSTAADDVLLAGL
jgi:hypothetical protein